MSQIIDKVADHASSVFAIKKKCQCNESVSELENMINKMKFHHGSAIKLAYDNLLMVNDPVKVSTISNLIMLMGKCICKIEKKIYHHSKVPHVGLTPSEIFSNEPLKKEGKYSLRKNGNQIELSLMSDGFSSTKGNLSGLANKINPYNDDSETSDVKFAENDFGSVTSTDRDFSEQVGDINTEKANQILSPEETHRLKTSGLIPQGETHRLKTSGLIPQGDEMFSMDLSEILGNIGTDKANRLVGGNLEGVPEWDMSEGITSLVDEIGTDMVNAKLDQIHGGAPENKEMAVIRYWGGDWCGPSIRSTPAWDEFKKKIHKLYPNLEVLHLNFYNKEDSKKQKILEKAGVVAFPTIRFYHNGVVDEFSGDRMNADEIVKFIQNKIK